MKLFVIADHENETTRVIPFAQIKEFTIHFIRDDDIGETTLHLKIILQSNEEIKAWLPDYPDSLWEFFSGNEGYCLLEKE